MKKHALSLVVFFITVNIVAQQQVFHLNTLSDRDTLLTGWKMYAGDEPRFADPGLDDSKWLPIDVTKDIQTYRQFHKSGIIWLRLHLSVDTSLKEQLLAAHIEQYTASALYLNGVLIQQYGIIDADPKKVQAWLPSAQPFSINLLKDIQNVIAVRVAYQPGIPYISYLDRYMPVFNLYINREKTAVKNYNDNEHQVKMYVIIFSISAGTLLIIGFIYLVYFMFDKSKKVHLYYALCMLAFSLNALPTEVLGAERYGKVAWMMWVFYIEGIAITIGMLFMILTVYSLFDYKPRAILKILIALSVVMIVGIYTNGTLAFFAVTYLVPAFYLAEGAHACFWAIRNHKKDAAIILVGLLFYLVISSLSIFIPIDSVPSQLLFYAAQMCFPIGMSFYLGIQSSLTTKQLRTTLAEVQNLSAKNLAQEQDKQHLLANQNELLEKQVAERTAALHNSLQELTSTQAQLIQSEKMASLGELTAGIAHEIQNPLNFVNNFSEISRELIDELKSQKSTLKSEEQEELLNDIDANLEKINHHGKRADAIVKGMLQHSQASKGKKEPTDINALCDEYMRLAYHGLRAKDKMFNATLKTDFDPSVGKVNIIPQDMGRVMLNLITNAFYAVAEKKKSGIENFEPTVSVSTKQNDKNVLISVTDNGNGIPPNIVDKIFQPFFTTKPTGQGTGLGLSLAYDIVKAHGGELKVETKQNDTTTFIIYLPL
ncbi:MAG: ATP-binding protein [Chitinophagaceae bacterium]